jgi:hypothetical protein
VQPRLRSLSEAECYARCYAAKTATVQVVRPEPRWPHEELPVSGEHLRAQLETRLDLRDAIALFEPEAA